MNSQTDEQNQPDDEQKPLDDEQKPQQNMNFPGREIFMEEKIAAEMKAAFMNVIVSGANLNHMCEIAAQYIGLPVAITITTRTIIGKSKDYSQELVSEYSNHLRFLNKEETDIRNRFVDSKLAEKKPYIGCFPMMRYPHIDCGCFLNSHMIGVLDIPVVLPMEKEEDTLKLVEMIAPMFVVALRLNKFATKDTRFSMQIYLAGLLNSDAKEWVNTNYIEDSELNKIKLWQIIYMPSVLHMDFTGYYDKVLEICSRYRYAWAVRYETGIVILKKAYEDFDLEALLKLIEPEDRIAVSEPFTDLKLIINHLHACQRTIDMSRFEEINRRILFVENYKMPIAYLVLKRMPNGMSLVHPAITQIKQYDRENQTEYFETLRAYLLHNMDYPEIADALHIHKNTVAYRIKRVEELFNLNLKDCRTITSLYLSLYSDYAKFRRENT